MKPIILLMLILVCSFSCNSKKEQRVDVITMNNTRPIDELKKLVLLKGDTAAYNELATAYLNEKYGEEYLIYSLVMANKYKYPRAYHEVYFCLTSAFNHGNGEIDEDTKAIAIKYLQTGVVLNDPASLMEMGELYLEGKYFPKDTILGNELYERGWK
jgi:hypothetical protein